MTLSRIDVSDAEISTIPARADTDSWIAVVAEVSKLAGVVAGTSFVPKGLRNDAPATAAAILYGREVGFPPMTALTSIHVIEGRPGISAEGMRSLVLAAGHEIAYETSTGGVCRMRGRRRGSSTWTSVEWTLDDARRAGLIRKDNWVKYPRSMLVARATGDLCRMLFPDVIHGFRTVEELDDFDDETPPAIESKTTRVQRRPSKRSGAASSSPPRVAPEPVVQDESPGPPLPHEEEQPETATAAGSGPRSPAAVVPDEEDDATPPVPTDEEPTREEPPQEQPPRMINRPTLRLMFREFNRLGVDDEQREKRLRILENITGREIGSSSELLQDEGTRALSMLSASKDLDALKVIVSSTAVEELPDEIAAETDEPLPAPDEP